MNFSASKLDKPVFDLENKPMKVGTGNDSPVLTVREALRRTCTSTVSKDAGRGEDMHEEKKYVLYDLAKRIMAAKEGSDLELTIEESAMIKERAKKSWVIECSGFICDFLEGKAVYEGETA